MAFCQSKVNDTYSSLQNPLFRIFLLSSIFFFFFFFFFFPLLLLLRLLSSFFSSSSTSFSSSAFPASSLRFTILVTFCAYMNRFSIQPHSPWFMSSSLLWFSAKRCRQCKEDIAFHKYQNNNKILNNFQTSVRTMPCGADRSFMISLNKIFWAQGRKTSKPLIAYSTNESKNIHISWELRWNLKNWK